MVSSMAALKKKRNILLEFCEVFINDPLVDWVKLTKDKKMGKSDKERNEYPYD